MATSITLQFSLGTNFWDASDRAKRIEGSLLDTEETESWTLERGTYFTITMFPDRAMAFLEELKTDGWFD